MSAVASQCWPEYSRKLCVHAIMGALVVATAAQATVEVTKKLNWGGMAGIYGSPPPPDGPKASLPIPFFPISDSGNRAIPR